MIRDNEKKILAGITQDNELYFLLITTERDGKPYFSMCGETVTPIKLEEAQERVREQLEEGEDWRYAVHDKRTELGLSDWVDYVLDTDGELAGFDNSLFTAEVKDDDGTEWIFESGSCGQHEEEDLKHYFIPKEMFDALMTFWKQYHMKTPPTGQPAATTLLNALKIEQDMEALALEAITIIENDN